MFGTNNDSFGFAEGLVEKIPGWRADAGPAVVVGAGGAARAVVHALLRRGAPNVHLVNRTRGRAEALAADFHGPIAVVDWEKRHAALGGAALLVNTTSQGMVGMPALDLRLDELPKSAVVADVVYIPGETPLLTTARRNGHPTVNGLGMLLHQARPAWQAWFGIDPQVTPEMRALIEKTI